MFRNLTICAMPLGIAVRSFITKLGTADPSSQEEDFYGWKMLPSYRVTGAMKPLHEFPAFQAVLTVLVAS